MSDKTNEKQNHKPTNLITSRTLAALLLFFAVNVAIISLVPKETKELTAKILTDNPNEKRKQGRWIWWVSRNYLKDHPDADIALMGSSMMSSAVYSAEANYLEKDVDCVTDKESNMLSDMLQKRLGTRPKSYVFAMGGAMASDHYMVASTLFNKKHKPKMVVVGVNPRDFIDNTMPSVSSTEPFFFLKPYAKLDSLADCAFGDPIERLEWVINDYLPIMSLGRSFKETIPKLSKQASNAVSIALTGKGNLETLEPEGEAKTEEVASAKKPKTTEDVLNAIYGKQSEVKPGVWVIPPRPFYHFVNNMYEYKRRYKNPNPSIYGPQKQFFQAFLKRLKDENIEVMVVGMPSLWPNRGLLPDKFWKDFNQFLASSCQEYGATWIDLSDDKRFNNRDYLDTVHMNKKGGDKLLEIIADEIRERKNLAASLTDSETDTALAGREKPENWQ